MALPAYQDVTLPLLRLASSTPVLKLADALEILSQEFRLTTAERDERTSSGRTKMNSRVLWAATYLAQARCVSRPEPGAISITSRGIELLATAPERVDYGLLRQFPEFVAFEGSKRSDSSGKPDKALDTPPTAMAIEAPEELIDAGYRALRAEVEAVLLDRLRSSTPTFFEQAVVDLLVAMQYGGSHENAARRIGGTSDEGIDGVIDEDRLGLDAVYVQAKRWKADHIVGSPEMHGFVGSLVGKRASKGVFITTSDFSQPALRYLDTIAHRVVTLNGSDVASLMFDYGIGVRTRHAYEIKAVDESYFGSGE